MDEVAKQNLLPTQLQRHYHRVKRWHEIRFVRVYDDDPGGVARVGVVLNDRLEGWVKTYCPDGQEFWVKAVMSAID